MPGQYDDDLFESTKMTFGEHLEELRVALFKSVLALGFGLIFGLLLGRDVVRLIQSPLEESLERYYADPATKDEVPMAREEFLVDPKQLLDALRQDESAAPSAASDGDASSESNSTDPNEKPRPEDPSEAGNDSESPSAVDKKNLVPITLWKPLADSRLVRSTTLSPQEGFLIFMKASLLTGFVLASPAIFYFLWSFVGAGLYPHEKSYVHIFLPFSLGLFLAGVALAFFVVFRYVLDFLFGINAWLGIDPDIRISEWFSFVLIMPIGFGIAFQLPLVMLFLDRIGVFSVESYLSKWRIAILIISIVSMLLTPADPMSMLLMAIPLVGLYFGGILLCHYMPRRRGPFE